MAAERAPSAWQRRGLHLGWPARDAGSFIKMPLGSSLHDVEKEMIIRTIEFTGGNKTRAAEILGVSSKTLYNKLEQYELER